MPGVKFMDLFCLKNMCDTTLFTEWKRQAGQKRLWQRKGTNLSLPQHNGQ